MAHIIQERDLGLKSIMNSLFKLNGKYVKIGLFGSEASPKNNIAARGAVHEFGTKNGHVPKRSFMRTTFDKELVRIQNEIRKELSDSLSKKNFGAFELLLPIGNWLVEKIKGTINNGAFKPLADSTVRKKGHNTILIDTGDMIKGLTVKKG